MSIQLLYYIRSKSRLRVIFLVKCQQALNVINLPYPMKITFPNILIIKIFKLILGFIQFENKTSILPGDPTLLINRYVRTYNSHKLVSQQRIFAFEKRHSANSVIKYLLSQKFIGVKPKRFEDNSFIAHYWRQLEVTETAFKSYPVNRRDI